MKFDSTRQNTVEEVLSADFLLLLRREYLLFFLCHNSSLRRFAQQRYAAPIHVFFQVIHIGKLHQRRGVNGGIFIKEYQPKCCAQND